MIPCSKTSTKMGSYILDYILGIVIAFVIYNLIADSSSRRNALIED